MNPTDNDVLRAARAVARFNRLCPGLTTVARACTGNSKVTVRSGSTSCTDGKVIWIRPSIKLGDDMTHERRACGKRDPETKIPLCPACRRDDAVLAVAYHEIAHIAFASFSKAGDNRTQLWAAKAKAKGHSAMTIQDADSKGGHLAVAGLVDPHLPWAFNAFEDVRVNTLMREERPGFINMMKAMTNGILADGIDDGKGGKIHWSDQPPHAQAGIAAYSMADETDDIWRPNLDASAVDIVFEDETIKRLAADVAETADTYGTMDLAFELVKRLRELGFFPEPEDDGSGDQSGDEDGEDGDETGESDAGQSRSGQGSGSGGDSATDPGEAAGGAPGGAEGNSGGGGSVDPTSAQNGDEDDRGDGMTDEQFADEVAKALDGAEGHEGGIPTEDDFKPSSGSGGGVGGAGGNSHNDDEYINEVFQVAIQQGAHFDAPSTEISGVQFRELDASTTSGYYSSMASEKQAIRSEGLATTQIVPGVVGPGVSRLRRVFDSNKNSGYDRNRRRGRVSRRGLAKKVVSNDDRMFQKKVLPKAKSYSVVIMMDMSGSTRDSTLNRAKAWSRYNGTGHTPTKNDSFQYPNGETMMVFDAMKHLASHLGDMLDRLGCDFSMYGHTSHLDYVSVGTNSMASFDVLEVKSESDPWGGAARHRLNALQGASGNLDGHAMEFARKRMEESSATDKIVFYMSDGEMPAANYQEEREILVRNCKIIKSAPDMHAVGIGVHCDSPKEFGLDTVIVNEATDLAKVIAKLERLMS